MNEPIRQSYLDVIKRNLKIANRNVFLTRLVYLGEYHCASENLQQTLKKIIEHLAAEYNDAPITGILLVYPQYFVHLLEASEEMIFRHLKVMYDDKNMEIEFGRVIPLLLNHHINQRFFTSWITVLTKPPTLLEKLETFGLNEIEKQMTNCLSKIYKLCAYIMDNTNDSESLAEVLAHLGEKVPQYLPENTVLEFLLNVRTPVLRDIQEYLTDYVQIPFIDFYNDKIWPPPSDFVPYDVFVERAPRRDLMPIQQSQQQQRQHM